MVLNGTDGALAPRDVLILELSLKSIVNFLCIISSNQKGESFCSCCYFLVLVKKFQNILSTCKY